MLRIQLRILALVSILASPLHATNLDLSPVPLFLGGAVEPNIMFTLDDSGSMHWENMPDDNWTYFVYPRANNVYGTSNYGNYLPVFSDITYSVRIRSGDINKVYYNPSTVYTPWSSASGVSMGDVSITCAPHNPYDTAKGCRNLTTNNTETANWETYNGDGTTFPGSVTTESNTSKTFWPAVYYIYQGGDTWTVASYQKIEIKSSTATYATNVLRTDCAAAPTCSYAEEIQNFANWYSYYRSRILAARGGVGRAFAKQGTNIRVGFASINKGSATIDGVSSGGALIDGVRSFSGTARTNFFDKLYGYPIPTSGTPLRKALEDVGGYFQRSDNTGPWSETPGTSNTASHLECRQSYNILMTDGYWNGSAPAVGNADNTDGVTISGPNNADYLYQPIAPYKDVTSDTLADVAMYYWKTDLRTGLSNEVPVNTLDPAFWQHLVNFTVGLGVTGGLDPTTDLAGLVAGATTWSAPTTNPTKIDDLWHAALNSRGGFFSASDPDTFADSLTGILSDIADRTSSASSVALNSGTVSGSSKLYQAKFDSGDWTGQLLAYPINTDGTLGTQVWDAATVLPAAASRIIFTFDGANGQPFSWGSGISTAQQTLIGNENTLNYLRGDQSLETSNGGAFRNRTSILGDIVHASPTYVGPPSLRYPDSWGSGAAENSFPYSTFKSNNSSRQALIYAGANDGMLHAFNVDTGVEAFAYIPNALYANLPDLADINYNHKFYVDGSPTVVDAFFTGDSAWHTVLVSGLRGGGQGIFAIDVTDPTAFNTETNAAAKVLWEFTDNANDEDLGYTFGKPSIVRMHNGVWAVVFSGGYNNTFDDDGDLSSTNDSTTGDAVLFIVNLETGALIKKLSTEVGTTEDPTGNGRPNGLSSPSIVDLDGDGIVDAIYAGDLFGNLWKIDVSSNNPNSWDFSYKVSGDPEPIYRACAAATCTSSNAQSITAQVQVIRHPVNSGYLVLFGTGKYFEVGDNSSTGQLTQTVYGIWDKAESTLTSFNRSNLLQQQILQEVTNFGFNLRVSTDNAIDWSSQNGWYMDLFNTESGNTNNYGERQVSNMIVRNGRLIFTTLVPSSDPCDFGGTGWLMEVDVNTGARLAFSPFDLNGDGVFDIGDYVNAGDLDGDGVDDYVVVSGKQSTVGIIPTPSITENLGGGTEYKFTSGSTGAIELTVENPGLRPSGRQSWRQLF